MYQYDKCGDSTGADLSKFSGVNCDNSSIFLEYTVPICIIQSFIGSQIFEDNQAFSSESYDTSSDLEKYAKENVTKIITDTFPPKWQNAILDMEEKV